MKLTAAYFLAVPGLIGIIIWVGAFTIDRLVTRAAAEARMERDLYWAGEIARSNAEAARQLNEQFKIAMEAQAEASDAIAAADRRQIELEKDNAALPDAGACGLSLERVRLLNQR